MTYDVSSGTLNLTIQYQFPCFLPSIGPGAEPGVHPVSPQVTLVIRPAVGCHYFPLGLRLPSQPQSITALWLVLILPSHGG